MGLRFNTDAMPVGVFGGGTLCMFHAEFAWFIHLSVMRDLWLAFRYWHVPPDVLDYSGVETAGLLRDLSISLHLAPI